MATDSTKVNSLPEDGNKDGGVCGEGESDVEAIKNRDNAETSTSTDVEADKNSEHNETGTPTESDVEVSKKRDSIETGTSTHSKEDIRKDRLERLRELHLRRV